MASAPPQPTLKLLNPFAKPYELQYCPHSFYPPAPPRPPVAVGWRPASQQFFHRPVPVYYPPTAFLPREHFGWYTPLLETPQNHKPSFHAYQQLDGSTTTTTVKVKVGGGCRRKCFSRRSRKPQGSCLPHRREKSCVKVWVMREKSCVHSDGGDSDILKSPTDVGGGGHEVLPSEITTVMIRNIPNKLSRNDLLRKLDEHCWEENEKSDSHVRAEYDFLYLPMDFRNKCNYGYAFVNFTSGDAATRVCKHLHNFRWAAAYGSKKVCEIGCARVQGKEALVDHFRSSVFLCHSDEYLPVVLSPPRDGSSPPSPPITVGMRVGCSRRP